MEHSIFLSPPSSLYTHATWAWQFWTFKSLPNTEVRIAWADNPLSILPLCSRRLPGTHLSSTCLGNITRKISLNGWRIATRSQNDKWWHRSNTCLGCCRVFSLWLWSWWWDDVCSSQCNLTGCAFSRDNKTRRCSCLLWCTVNSGNGTSRRHCSFGGARS